MNLKEVKKLRVGDKVRDIVSGKTGTVNALVVGQSLDECEIHAGNDGESALSLFPQDLEIVKPFHEQMTEEAGKTIPFGTGILVRSEHKCVLPEDKLIPLFGGDRFNCKCGAEYHFSSVVGKGWIRSYNL